MSKHYVKPTAMDAAFNGAVGWFTKLGLPFAGSRVLSVRGRTSGEWRSTPVNPLRVEGQRYLVSPRGHTQWVRNIRVSGEGRLATGRKVEDIRVEEVPDAAKPPILRAYLVAWAWEVGRFFEDVDKNSPDERLLEVAPDFPVFRILPSGGVVTEFPDAEYVILSSRLIPDMDGGYTLATLARARQMAAAGVHDGRGPLLLTVDPGTAADHARHRAAFDGRELVVDPARMRNLFDEASDARGGAADWLLAAAHPGDPDPALEYRQIDAPGAGRIVALPIIAADPDWHITTAPVVVYRASGTVAGVLDGFGALYRAWLAEVVRELRGADAERPVVVICESRQLGELLVGWDDADVRLVHAIHTVHLEPPYEPDGPLNSLWTRWFTVAERFDAVLWPTALQRDEVEQRFGASPVHVVVPHGVPAAASVPPLSARNPGRVVMLNRLAPGKRVDDAIRAFALVVPEVPGATLDIHGDGAEHDGLQALIDERDLGAHVVLRGRTDDPGRVLDEASVFLSTSAFEGQGLSLVEALAHGCPVIAYDVPYGPREILARGGGWLIPDGDERALATALVRLLTEIEMRARLSEEAVQVAREVSPERVMGALAAAAADVLARPSRRG